MKSAEAKRYAEITRNTAETQISLKLSLDGSGTCTINTGVGFMDHMLNLFARHGSFDLEISCCGDTYIDDHHSTEDIGICLGMAFAEALGNMGGINRYGNIVHFAVVVKNMKVKFRGIFTHKGGNEPLGICFYKEFF